MAYNQYNYGTLPQPNFYPGNQHQYRDVGPNGPSNHCSHPPQTMMQPWQNSPQTYSMQPQNFLGNYATPTLQGYPSSPYGFDPPFWGHQGFPSFPSHGSFPPSPKPNCSSGCSHQCQNNPGNVTNATTEHTERNNPLIIGNSVKSEPRRRGHLGQTRFENSGARNSFFTGPKSENVIDLTEDDVGISISPISGDLNLSFSPFINSASHSTNSVLDNAQLESNRPQGAGTAQNRSFSPEIVMEDARKRSSRLRKKVRQKETEPPTSESLQPVGKACKLCSRLPTEDKPPQRFAGLSEKKAHAKRHATHSTTSWHVFLRKCFGSAIPVKQEDSQREPANNATALQANKDQPPFKETPARGRLLQREEPSNAARSDSSISSTQEEYYAPAPHERARADFVQADSLHEEDDGAHAEPVISTQQGAEPARPPVYLSSRVEDTKPTMLNALRTTNTKLVFMQARNTIGVRPKFPRRLKEIERKFVPRYAHRRIKCQSCDRWLKQDRSDCVTSHVHSHLPMRFPLYSCGYCDFEGKGPFIHWRKGISIDYVTPFRFTDNSVQHDSYLVEVLEECFGGSVEKFSESLFQEETSEINPPTKFLNFVTKLKNKLRGKPEKSLMCAVCGNGSILWSSVASHVYAHAKEVQMFQCKLCEEMLSYNKLQKHMFEHGVKRTAKTVLDLRYQYEETLIEILEKCFC